MNARIDMNIDGDLSLVVVTPADDVTLYTIKGTELFEMMGIDDREPTDSEYADAADDLADEIGGALALDINCKSDLRDAIYTACIPGPPREHETFRIF